jgi:hypothetical protein
MANLTQVSAAADCRSKNSIGISTSYFLNESPIALAASEPTAASLLSGLPSSSRSKPSVDEPIDSVEMIESSIPWYGVTAAPVHSGFGWNSGGLALSLPQAVRTQNGATSAAPWIARNFMTPPRPAPYTARLARVNERVRVVGTITRRQIATDRAG